MNTTQQLNEWQSPYDSDVLEHDKQDTLLDRATGLLKDFANFSSLLRIFGAMAVLASMSMFLMQGWNDTNDFERFCMMIAQTFLLGTGGLAMVKVLKENKGARLFFGLALVSVTANFTTLGALIYSVFSWDQVIVEYPSFALWKATSASVAVMSTGIAIVTLLPLTWLAFSVLVRPAAKQLTLWYVGMNMLLLIPVRDVTIIIALVAIASVALMQLFVKKSGDNATSELFSWKTQEGKYARIVLFVPAVIMLVRSVLHYDFSTMAILMTTISVYALSVFTAKVLDNQASPFVQLLGLIAGLHAAVIVSFEMALPISEQLDTLVFGLVFGAICGDVYRRSVKTWMQGFAKNVGAILITLCLVANHLMYTSFTTAFTAIVIASLMLLAAIKIKDIVLSVIAVGIVVSLPAFHFATVMDFFIGSGWLGFAVGGVSIIILASLLERYGAILKLKLSKFSTNHQQDA